MVCYFLRVIYIDMTHVAVQGFLLEVIKPSQDAGYVKLVQASYD